MELNADELSPGRLYALDTVALIYFLERHPDYYQKAKALFRKIEEGEISGVLSSLLFAELLVPAFRAGESRRADNLARILTNFPNLGIVPLTTEISTMAARLRASHGLRTPDAIHAATALASRAAGIITNDKDFLKLATKDFSVWLFDAT